MSGARHRVAWLVLLTVGLAVVAGVTLTTHATAQPALDIAVRGSDFQADGTTSLVVNVTGPAKPDVLDADAFAVTENGRPVAGLEVAPLLDTDDLQVTAALVLDTSGSMVGQAIDDLKAASAQMVDTLTSQDIAVALFEFNRRAILLSSATTDTDLLLAEIDAIEADGRTALYDALIAGIDEVAPLDGVRNVIIFADGEDNESSATADDAIEAAQDAEVPITVVALETDILDIDILRPLASATGGQFVAASDTSQFEAIFAELADDVASQYTLAYTAAAVDTSELDLTISVDVGSADATTTFTALNVRDAGATGLPPPPAVAAFDAGILGAPVALWTATGIAFVGLALFLTILLVPRGDRAASRTLATGLAVASRGGSDRPSTGLSASGLGQRAIALVDAVPKPEGYEDRLQARLDRAGWQLRGSEFTAMQVGLVVAGFALAWALTTSLFFGVLGGVAGFFGPVLALTNSEQRRQNAFMAQLPGTLQLLSGTLKAGYGTLQGIDTIVKETEAPMSTEFQRVLTEARLGLPLEDSLDAMAERIDNDDFRWVVVAMNIQRQVGGNLAALLETVSETLRGREAVRRQIQVLSAEGRLSAIILIALPFVLMGYMLLVSPDYLGQLVESAVGLLMVGGAATLMLLGIVWMRRLIKIDV